MVHKGGKEKREMRGGEWEKRRMGERGRKCAERSLLTSLKLKLSLQTKLRRRRLVKKLDSGLFDTHNQRNWSYCRYHFLNGKSGFPEDVPEFIQGSFPAIFSDNEH